MLRFHREAGESEGLYGNQPKPYPVCGRKALNPTFWSDHVLYGQRPYVGRAYGDIRSTLVGRELINLLRERRWYEDPHIEGWNISAALAVAGLVMPQQSP